MKTQIKFQKILFLVTLIVAALTLVYGFSFCTGSLQSAFKVVSAKYSNPFDKNPINADALYTFVIGDVFDSTELTWTRSQVGFNDLLIVMSVVFVVIAALQYFFASNNRRNYYITNYISVGVLVVYALVLTIVAFWGISTTLSLFNNINWDYYYKVYQASVAAGGGAAWAFYDKSYIMFILGYILYAIVLIDAVLLVLNTVWKVLLMKGEKALLENSLNKTGTEVAQ